MLCLSNCYCLQGRGKRQELPSCRCREGCRARGKGRSAKAKETCGKANKLAHGESWKYQTTKTRAPRSRGTGDAVQARARRVPQSARSRTCQVCQELAITQFIYFCWKSRMLSSIVCRAEANAKNYRAVTQEKVVAREAEALALKQKKLAQKQVKLHMEKAESISHLKRERNAAEERQMQFKRERDESRSRLEAERARCHTHSQHTHTHTPHTHTHHTHTYTPHTHTHHTHIHTTHTPNNLSFV